MSIYNSYDINKHSIRLKDFDYRADKVYFVTVVTNSRRHLFGDIQDGIIEHNDAGKMVLRRYAEIADRFQGMFPLDVVLMPNHLHCILQNTKEGENLLFDVMQWFKGVTTFDYKKGVSERGWKRFDQHLWQPRYYDSILWNERMYKAVIDYIAWNPFRWQNDKLNPDCGEEVDDINSLINELR